MIVVVFGLQLSKFEFEVEVIPKSRMLEGHSRDFLILERPITITERACIVETSLFNRAVWKLVSIFV